MLHLPVRGSGDGGVYSTAPRTSASLWRAFLAGRIVPPRWVAEMARPRSDVPGRREALRARRSGSTESTDAVHLDGYDAGVSFMSTHDPASATTRTVISNTSEGAWDMVELLNGERA